MSEPTPSSRLRSRPAQDLDLGVICLMPATVLESYHFCPSEPPPVTPDGLARVAAKRCCATVVLVEDRVAGYANIFDVHPDETCCIGNVIVDPTLRRQGVGAFLLRTMIELAQREHRVAEPRICCFSSNPLALLLYRRLGFLPFEVEARPGPAGERLALIHLRLDRKLLPSG